jgi:pyrroline-5-carboxylate reductase
MHTILLIGAGNIGRRHLQGLLLSPFSYSIYVVDPIAACLDLAKAAVAEVEAPTVALHTIQYLSSIQLAPTNCDVAIIATNADVRKLVVEELIAHTTPRYLILEKVLFQKEADYKTIGQLIYQKNIPTFVNCTRRYFSH